MSSAPVSEPPAPRPAPEPFSPAVLAELWRRPHRLYELVLAAPDRVGASFARSGAPGSCLVLLLCGAALFALPYGLVLGWDSWWRVSIPYLGSTLICLPSLHVCASFIGARVSMAQVLAIGLLLSAAAGAFTLGFSPILAFLRFTMESEATQISWVSISNALLYVALGAGIVQLWRCFAGAHGWTDSALFALVLVFWHGVFLYVFRQVHRVLELAA